MTYSFNIHLSFDFNFYKNLLKFPYLFAIRFFGKSYSMIRPKSRTRILSLFLILLRRWATVGTVDPFKLVSIKFWIDCSVTTSMLEVASSRITTFDLLKISLQILMSYFLPELRLLPFSEILRASPSSWMRVSRRAAFKILIIPRLLLCLEGRDYIEVSHWTLLGLEVSLWSSIWGPDHQCELILRWVQEYGLSKGRSCFSRLQYDRRFLYSRLSELRM